MSSLRLIIALVLILPSICYADWLFCNGMPVQRGKLDSYAYFNIDTGPFKGKVAHFSYYNCTVVEE